MKRDIVFSLILHTVAISLLVFSSPFVKSKPFDYEVIRVNAVSPAGLPPPPGQQTAQPTPVTIPQAMAEEQVQIPVDKPSSIKKPVPTKTKTAKQPEKKPPKQTSTQPTQAETSGSGDNEAKQIDVNATGSGASFGGATIDNASFNYPYWFTQAFNKIASNWHRTVLIDAPVVCVVYFQVIKSGRLLEVRVEKSSGIPSVDETCVLAIQSSAPFPPLPEEFRDEIIGITIPFKYQPR